MTPSCKWPIGQSKYCIPWPFSRCLISMQYLVFLTLILFLYILNAYQGNDVFFIETTFSDLHGAFDTDNVFVLDEKGVRDEESSKTNKGRQGMASELQKRATMFELRNDCAFLALEFFGIFLPL